MASAGSMVYASNYTDTFKKGDEIYLSNYVKESGYNYAAIKTLSDHQVPYTIKFWWSPDSI